MGHCNPKSIKRQELLHVASQLAFNLMLSLELISILGTYPQGYVPSKSALGLSWASRRFSAEYAANFLASLFSA